MPRRRPRFGHPAKQAAIAQAREQRISRAAALDACTRAGDHVDTYRKLAEALEDFYGADFRDLGWGTMHYGCAGPQHDGGIGCGFQHQVWLGLGVEGPPEVRADLDLFIPAPMGCGGCPDCGRRLQHIRWNSDEEFAPVAIPDDAARFYVPTRRKWRLLADYGGADYRDPTGRTN